MTIVDPQHPRCPPVKIRPTDTERDHQTKELVDRMHEQAEQSHALIKSNCFTKTKTVILRRKGERNAN